MELFVLLACIQGVACTETSDAYFYHNPRNAIYVHNAEQNLERKLEPYYLNHAASVLLIASGHSYSVKLSPRWALKGEPGWSHLSLSYSRAF